jgi:PAS domain S-box-containing protein
MNTTSLPSQGQLLTENAELREKLAEAEELLNAIRAGEVDALVVQGSLGARVFTLQGPDAESSRLRGEMLAQVSDAVVAIDNEHRVIYLNAAAERQYGVTASEVLGRKLREVHAQRWLHPEDEDAQRNALLERGEWRGENLHVLRDGRVLAVEMSVSVFRHGGADGLIAVIRDVSERNRMVQALQDADRLKDEFLATLAHELRNPLAPVLNAVQLLHLRGPATPELQWVRDVILRQVRHLTRLIDDLMDVSRISRGKIELKRERIELAQAVKGAVETSRPLIEESGHELFVSVPARPIILDADLTRLTQVIWNLLNNAAKYMSRGGRIELCVEPQGTEVVVSVKDRGIGLPADKLPTIFGMFSQVESSLSRSQGGLGIGLYLVKRLVEMHGGSVEVHSEGLGKGAEFAIRLPISAGEESGQDVAARGATAVPASSLRILVVDDNLDAANSLAVLLRTMGNNVRTAHDGEEAVRAAGEFRPHVALLDIGMPKMNGYEAARAIRQQPWGQKLVLVAVTGWGQEEDKRRSKEAGFDHHLVKPVDPYAVMKQIAEWNCEKDFFKR